MIGLIKKALKIFTAENSIVVIVEKVVTAFARFVSLYFIIKLFGANGQGEYSYVNTIWNVALIFVLFGFDVSVIFFVSKKTESILNSIISNSIVFLIITFVLGFLGFFLLNTFTSVFDKISNTLFYLSYIGTVVFLIKYIFRGILYGLGKFIEQFVGIVLVEIGFLIISIIFYILKVRDLELLISSYILLVVLSLIYWLIIINKIEWKFKFKFDKLLFFDQIKYGSKVYINSILLSLNLRLDAFIIMYFLDTAYYGYYFVAVAISEIINYIPQALTVVILNNVSKNKNGYNLSQFPTLIAVLLSFAIAIGLVGSVLIPIVYGNEYIASIIPFIILIVGAIPMGLTTIASYYLLGVDQGKKLILPSVIALVSTITLDLLLIPVLGIIGAAIASTISYSLFCIFTLIYLYRYSNKTSKSWYLFLIPSFGGAYQLVINKIKN